MLSLKIFLIIYCMQIVSILIRLKISHCQLLATVVLLIVRIFVYISYSHFLLKKNGDFYLILNENEMK